MPPPFPPPQIYRKQKNKVSGQLIWEAMSKGQEPDVDACAWFSGNMTLLSSQPKKVRGAESPFFFACQWLDEGSCGMQVVL